MKKNNKKGFTLVELLTVIAVIGILAGVVMIGLSSMRARARLAAAQQTAQSVMPFVAECYVKSSSSTFATPTGGTGGGSPCTGSANYPPLGSGSTRGCCYSTLNSSCSDPDGSEADSFSVYCEEANAGFTCSAATSDCK